HERAERASWLGQGGHAHQYPTSDPRSPPLRMNSAVSLPGAAVADLVRLEAVLDAPQHGLRAPLDAHLAVGGADVGLDGVDAQVAAIGDLLVGEPLGDQGADLRLPHREPLLLAGPGAVGPRVDRPTAARHHGLAGVDLLDRPH